MVLPREDKHLQEVIDQGCWTPQEYINGVHASCEHRQSVGWSARLLAEDASKFELLLDGDVHGVVTWNQCGQHNLSNAIAAVAAARHVGVPIQVAIEALATFQGVARRMDLLGKVDGVSVYDDFAHHPTAIEMTLQGLRARVGEEKIIAIIEPRSNTMKLGVHQHELADSIRVADEVLWFQSPGIEWDLASVMESVSAPNNCSVLSSVFTSVEAIVDYVVAQAQAESHVLVMSNGGFGGIHQKLLQGLKER
jgi:UDP-N-acetylmuramate: L-alanyl-gamma-D-glutamyl-meso-diaminopimelate ligase